MRVLVIASYADSVFVFREHLISAMLAMGWEVHVAAPQLRAKAKSLGRSDSSTLYFHDIEIIRSGRNPLADFALLFRLARLIVRLRPNALLPYTVKPVIYGMIAGWLMRVPYRFPLITGLGYAFTGSQRRSIRVVISWMYRIALARSTKVFFQNPDDERCFRQRRVLPADLPSVVLNGSGVDLKHFESKPLPLSPVSFIMIARLLGDKGVREYAAAAAQLKREFPSAEFRLAGWIDDNPNSIEQAELDRWVESGAIKFLGKLTDVRQALESSWVYVLPSYREGTPRTVLEAMASARPIITTDVPGCRETVVEGQNGFLVPAKSSSALGAAMRRFLVDPGLAPRMGLKSRRIAERKFDVHHVNEVMLAEISSSLSEG